MVLLLCKIHLLEDHLQIASLQVVAVRSKPFFLRFDEHLAGLDAQLIPQSIALTAIKEEISAVVPVNRQTFRHSDDRRQKDRQSRQICVRLNRQSFWDRQ